MIDSILILPILISFFIAAIVMVIGNSLALAFAAFGAVSLIRFRTAIKDARDIAFVLLAVVIGFSSGTGSYVIGIATSVFGFLIAFVIEKHLPAYLVGVVTDSAVIGVVLYFYRRTHAGGQPA